jgi:hypothetical protein
MNLHPGDIYIKNDKGSVSVWISECATIAESNIADHSYLRIARHRYAKTIPQSVMKEFQSGTRQLLPDNGTGWRYGRVNGQYYYCLDNIPPKYRLHLPTREELLTLAEGGTIATANLTRENFARFLKESVSDYINQEDIHYYMYEAEYKLPLSLAVELTQARGWLEMIWRFEDDKVYLQHGIRFEQDFYEVAAETMPKFYGNKLTTAESLRIKVLLYGKHDKSRDFVIPHKLGNNNRRVVGIDQIVSRDTGEIFDFDYHEALIYELWMNPFHSGKRLKTDIYDLYASEIEQYGYSPVKERTVCFYLNRFSTRALMAKERHGKDYFNDKYMPYIVQKPLKQTLTMWAADFSGSKLYHRTYKDKWVNGKRQRERVAVAQSWYLFRVVDVASGCIAGWDVCKSGEDWQQIATGLKRAVESSGGYIACELVTDNGPAFTKKENRDKLSLLFEKHRCIRVGNKQANPAEQYVHFLSQKARAFDNWMRSSFAAKGIDNMANPDYVDINNLPSEDEAHEQIAQLINQWNATERKNHNIPNQYYNNPENRNPQAKKLEEKTARRVFGATTTSKLSRSRGILILSRGTGQFQEQFKFAIPSWETALVKIDKALHGSSDLEVKIHWDENSADIYTPSDEYILSAFPVTEAHKSEFESTEATSKALEDQTASKARFHRAADEFRDGVMAAREALREDVTPDELTYTQRAALNGGKAKDDHDKIMKAVYEINNKIKPMDEDPIIGSVLNDF